jgi:hypothetical protein
VGIHDAATAILSYFMRNPKAVDDLEGMARWRLVDERTHDKVQETDSALQWLVAEGLLIASTVPGGRSVFSLNPDRTDAARKFLDGAREFRRLCR